MAPVTKPKHAGKAIVAGGVSGAIEICCTYPLEYTKTVAQLSTNRTSAMEVVRNTLRTSGPAGMYRGLSSMVYFATPKAAIRFSGFEAATNMLTGADGKPMFGGFTSFIAGLCAGTAEAICVTTPQETIKVKLIDDMFKSETPRFNGFFHGVKTIVGEEGLGGCYLGLAPTILKVATAQATRFGIFNVIPAEYRKGPVTAAARPRPRPAAPRRRRAPRAARRAPADPPRRPTHRAGLSRDAAGAHRRVGRLRGRRVGAGVPGHRRDQIAHAGPLCLEVHLRDALPADGDQGGGHPGAVQGHRPAALARVLRGGDHDDALR